MTLEMKSNYFVELAIRLNRDGFATLPLENGLLEISQNGQHLCWVDSNGYVRYRSEELTTPQVDIIHNKITPEARITAEYMKLYEKAPALEVDGLDETYRTLADFNGVVLAAHQNRYGMQFATWSWGHKREGLYHGHYSAHHYEEAKQDFAVRSGLISEQQLFKDEQLIEIYRCCADALDAAFDLTYEQEKCIKSVQEQIKTGMPDIMDRIREQDQHTVELDYGQEQKM